MSTPGEVGLAVKRLQAHHHREASRHLAPLGLSLPQWDMLRHLGEHPEASLHDLAVLTFQTDQSAGALAVRMIQRGLLERVVAPGRAIRHRMTPEGARVRQEGAEVFEGVLAETVGRLSDQDRDSLMRLLLAASEGDLDT